MRKFNLIVATDLNGGIGKNNDLPWRCRKEFAHFQKKSSELKDGKQAAAIMGRNTWESLPSKSRPLKGRKNIIISRTLSSEPLGNASVYTSLGACMVALDKDETVGNIFLLGGSGIYQEGLRSERCHRLYRTIVQGKYDCDVFFPKFSEEDFEIVIDPVVPQGPQVEEDGTTWSVTVYQKKST